MNSKTRARIIALTLFAAVAIPVGAGAQDNATQNHNAKHHHYQLIDMGTLGGPNSYIQSGFPPPSYLNSRGLAIAQADTSIPDPYGPNCFIYDCMVTHSITWRNGVQTDLGALPGVNSSLPSWVNDHGDVVGLSENSVIDPLTGFPEIIGVLWKDGAVLDPFTLGGNASYPNAINNRGQVVGTALNTIPDSYAGNLWPPLFPVATQFRAFLWQDGVTQDLGTLGTGNDAGAVFVNEHGQVAGLSYTNTIPNATTGIPTLDPFFWENGKIVDIGTLGGTIGVPYTMNNRGQVAGYSNLAGDQSIRAFLWDKKRGLQNLGTLPGGSTSIAIWINDAGEVVGQSDDASTAFFGFLWKNGVMTNLGTVAGDVCSIANSINSQGQIIGVSSIDCNNDTHWFLWENGGPAIDLQTLVPPDSGVTLANVAFINDRGEIEGDGTLTNGDSHSILLIPCDESHPDVKGCDYSLADASTAAAGVSSAPATQPPAALTPGTRIPGGLNRFRFPRGRPTPGPGTAAVSSSQPVPSVNPATTDWLSDHKLVPHYGQNTGYCEIQNGVLNGACAVATSTDTCHVTFTGCPTGQPATGGGEITCAVDIEVSLSTTKCSSVAGFDVSATALTPVTVSAGGSATSTLTVSEFDGFSGNVGFTCSVQPAPALAPTCSFSPSSVTPGTPATLTVHTTAPTGALLSGSGPGSGSGLFLAFLLPLSGLFAMVVRFGPTQKRSGRFTATALACILFAGVVFQAACGAGTPGTPPSPGTPAGSYIITVTGTDSSRTVVSSVILPPLTVQ